MDDYPYFTKDTTRWEQVTKATQGFQDICSLLTQFYAMVITQSHLSAISWEEAWGDPKRPKFGMAYLLLALAQEGEEERKFGLVAIWVHSYQTILPSLEEVVKKLTLLINTRED